MYRGRLCTAAGVEDMNIAAMSEAQRWHVMYDTAQSTQYPSEVPQPYH